MTIIADTGAIIALIDADDRHHEEVAALFELDRGDWILPWAILPEVDYLLGRHVGERAQRAFLRDLAAGAYTVEWGIERDLLRAAALCERYTKLALGLVDAAVIAVSERLRADAIVTLDIRDFAAVRIDGAPRLLPRDA